jgi:endonuclease YncB( thermonuclease family)
MTGQLSPDFSWESYNEQLDKSNKMRDGFSNDLMKHGEGLYETWTSLAYQDPPKDMFGRILWSFGVLGQLLISTFTFPAALGCFLLEEAVQTYGMGAYMLSTAKSYDTLDTYLDGYKHFIDAATTGTKTLASLNPMTGGAVLLYMSAATSSYTAFRDVCDKKLLEQAVTDEKALKKLLDSQKYGSLSIKSIPSDADIIINGVDTETLTPETFKQLEAGNYIISLSKYSKTRETTDIYTFNINITAGIKKEVLIRIPEDVTGDGEKPDSIIDTDTPQLPDMIKSQVKGEHVTDGDTFVTTSGEKIRLLGIDAPELGRPYADLAKTFLEGKTVGKSVELSIQTHLPTDTYGRTLAMCYYRDENLSVSLVAAGLAKVFIANDARYDTTRLKEAERIAKERRIGIWSDLP